MQLTGLFPESRLTIGFWHCAENTEVIGSRTAQEICTREYGNGNVKRATRPVGG